MLPISLNRDGEHWEGLMDELEGEVRGQTFRRDDGGTERGALKGSTLGGFQPS